MLNHPKPLQTFYPAYCFPLSPTYNTWARLTAKDVHALQERLGFEGTMADERRPNLTSLFTINPSSTFLTRA